jgi:multiple sugar transport system ATP-binding protein
MASIRLENVTKAYPAGNVALRDLCLDVADGELLTLVGPSGGGKTTTLRLIAGLETPTSGRILLAGHDETLLPPHQRHVAMLFQNPALYPHLTIRGNLEFPLRLQHLRVKERCQRVADAARLLELEAILDRRSTELSGGEQQRAALARAVVCRPRAFLLDEPLSNLDAPTRLQLRTELAELHRQLGTTTIHVTHDQEEALALGERVAVLADGVLQQIGRPTDIYNRPANTFVGTFIGSPAMNLLPCATTETEQGLQLTSPFLQLGLQRVNRNNNLPTKIVLGIRPQDMQVVGDAAADLLGRLEMTQFLGNEQICTVRLVNGSHDQIVSAVAPARLVRNPGGRIGLKCQYDRLHFFDAATGRRLDWRDLA